MVYDLEKPPVGLEIRFAAQYRTQIEAESVHMELFHPIAQAVGRPAGYVAADDIQRIAAPRPVFIVSVAVEPVPKGIVYPPLAKHRPLPVLLGGMVVNHVQNHFDTGFVQRAHGFFQLVFRVGGIDGIRRLDREMGIGVVAPVIAQALPLQMIFVQMLVDGQQFDGGDAQFLQIIDEARIRQSLISTFVFQMRKLLGQAFDVGFVKHRPAPRRIWVFVVAPVEPAFAGHYAFWGDMCIVALVRMMKPSQFFLVAVNGLAVDFFGIRVYQQLLRIETRTARGIFPAVYAEAVPLPRPYARNETVKHRTDLVRQGQARFDITVEQAQFYFFGIDGKQGEIHALIGQGGTHRVRHTFFDMPCCGSHDAS